MAITQDYQIEFNTLLLGTDTPYDIVALLGAGIPPIRALDINRMDDHGSFPTRRELMQSRTLNIEVDIIATEVTDLHDKVNAIKNAFAPSDLLRPLDMRIAATGWGVTPTDVVRAYGYVRQLTSNLGDTLNFNVAKAYIQFECPDPRVYAALPQVASTTITSVTGGWTFPWTFPWTFADVVSGIVDAFNGGSVNSPPVIRFTGPILNPKVTHIPSGRFMQFDLNIPTGQYLELNFLDKTALLDGTASRYNTRVFGSSWFTLTPGSNPLQFSAASGSGTMTVTSRSAWA